MARNCGHSSLTLVALVTLAARRTGAGARHVVTRLPKLTLTGGLAPAAVVTNRTHCTDTGTACGDAAQIILIVLPNIIFSLSVNT